MGAPREPTSHRLSSPIEREVKDSQPPSTPPLQDHAATRFTPGHGQASHGLSSSVLSAGVAGTQHSGTPASSFHSRDDSPASQVGTPQMNARHMLLSHRADVRTEKAGRRAKQRAEGWDADTEDHGRSGFPSSAHTSSSLAQKEGAVQVTPKLRCNSNRTRAAVAFPQSDSPVSSPAVSPHGHLSSDGADGASTPGGRSRRSSEQGRAGQPHSSVPPPVTPFDNPLATPMDGYSAGISNTLTNSHSLGFSQSASQSLGLANSGSDALQAHEWLKRKGSRSRARWPAAARSDHARKVPLPAILASNSVPRVSSRVGSRRPSKGMRGHHDEGGSDSDGSACSIGLSGGLPGLSNEVAETLTHLSAAETLEASVAVTPLSLRDWLTRPAPAPMDPSLSLHGAAAHNAHIACCEVIVGGLLAAIQDGTIDRPSPSAVHPARARGAPQDSRSSVYQVVADWMEGLLQHKTKHMCEGVLQDERCTQLLTVLRADALQTVEDMRSRKSGMLQRAQRNSADMLQVLTTALFPAFRHHMSPRPSDSATPASSLTPSPAPSGTLDLGSQAGFEWLPPHDTSTPLVEATSTGLTTEQEASDEESSLAGIPSASPADTRGLATATRQPLAGKAPLSHTAEGNASVGTPNQQCHNAADNSQGSSLPQQSLSATGVDGHVRSERNHGGEDMAGAGGEDIDDLIKQVEALQKLTHAPSGAGVSLASAGSSSMGSRCLPQSKSSAGGNGSNAAGTCAVPSSGAAPKPTPGRDSGQTGHERVMYEQQLAQQRMMINACVNMNMMQNQMATAMFSSMMQGSMMGGGGSFMGGAGPAPGVERFAMLRSLARRHGISDISSLPLQTGQSMMESCPSMLHGGGGSMMGGSMRGGGSIMQPPVHMPQVTPLQLPRHLQTPIERFASEVTMPYVQVDGTTPLPQRASAVAHPPAAASMASQR